MRHLSLAGSIVSIINTWTAVELSMVSVERVNEVRFDRKRKDAARKEPLPPQRRERSPFLHGCGRARELRVRVSRANEWAAGESMWSPSLHDCEARCRARERVGSR